MIDALIAGRIYGKPTSRTGNNGRPSAVTKIRVPTRDGEAHFINVIAFAEPAVKAILALSEGDSIALSGELTPKVWTDKEGVARPSLDLLAHAVLTEYHVTRKRQAMAAEEAA
jgi:single-stranded DNA-binding protein